MKVKGKGKARRQAKLEESEEIIEINGPSKAKKVKMGAASVKLAEGAERDVPCNVCKKAGEVCRDQEVSESMHRSGTELTEDVGSVESTIVLPVLHQAQDLHQERQGHPCATEEGQKGFRQDGSGRRGVDGQF